jgi:hypothetical protein
VLIKDLAISVAERRAQWQTYAAVAVLTAVPYATISVS